MTSHMSTWTAASTTPPAQSCPIARYESARAAEASVRARLDGLVDQARAAGFDSRELLEIPAIRQTLRAARHAVDELNAARVLLAA